MSCSSAGEGTRVTWESQGVQIVQALLCTKVLFFLYAYLLGKGASERILKTGIRLFRCSAVAFLCKWQIKWNALTVAPYLSLIFSQSIQGAKSPCLVWPSVGFQLYVLTENMWLRECVLQITSDLREERIAPMPYAKIPALLPQLHTDALEASDSTAQLAKY